MIKKKICMLGTLAVGKTSLVRRFVSNTFSDKYLSTIGVKIEQRELTLNSEDLTLVLWDLHGDDQFKRLETSYLRGASGYFLVGDVTRKDSFEALKEIHLRAREALGEVPYVVLLNKVDLLGAGEELVGKDYSLIAEADASFKTSAKTGEGVEEAMYSLAERIV